MMNSFVIVREILIEDYQGPALIWLQGCPWWWHQKDQASKPRRPFLLKRNFIYLEGLGFRVQIVPFFRSAFSLDVKASPHPPSFPCHRSSLIELYAFCISLPKQKISCLFFETVSASPLACAATPRSAPSHQPALGHVHGDSEPLWILEKLFWAPCSASFGRPCPRVWGFQNPQYASAGL